MVRRGKDTNAPERTGPNRKGRELSAEDRALWRKVARTTNPLPGRSADLLSSSAPPAGPEDRPQRIPLNEPDQGLMRAMRAALAMSWKGSASEGAATAPRNAASPGRPGARLHPIEKPVRRKLASGRVPLEARIDLHGMAQADAHPVLLDFLRRAQRDGARHVLVITGKGASFGSHGVLKQAVPRWFAQPEFAAFVAGYDWAARGHGGEGALYVRLKRRREPHR